MAICAISFDAKALDDANDTDPESQNSSVFAYVRLVPNQELSKTRGL